jgi:hypothetical protein
MALNYTFKPPTILNTQSLRARIMNAIKPVAKDMETMLNQYVDTWEEHHPSFTSQFGYQNGEYYAWAGLNGWGEDERIFYYIDHGTAVRYATMTEDFVAKTAPHSVRSGQGQGGLNYVDVSQPRQGIEAREVSKEIADTMRAVFFYRIANVFKEITP